MSRRRKILTVVGARPQFIKAALVSQAIAAGGKFDEVMVHTGQHFDHGMSDVFFEELGIAESRWSSGSMYLGLLIVPDREL
jgi:UDP-GlcNAc3NAcA epimerase